MDQPFTFTVQVFGEPKEGIGWHPTYGPGLAPAREPIPFVPRTAKDVTAVQAAGPETSAVAAADAPEEGGQNLWVTALVALLSLLTLGVIGIVIAGRIRRTK